MAMLFAPLLQIFGFMRPDSYRPERHYMRGPGPKCRAKLGPIDTAPRPELRGG